jgi:heme-degrading monooxygenase HmoA
MNFKRFPKASYANIFSYRPSTDREGYAEMDELTLHLVGEIDGYCGYESVKNEEGRSIFISYWESLEAIDRWRLNVHHRAAKSHGTQWYSAYHSMLVKIEHSSEHNTQIL